MTPGGGAPVSFLELLPHLVVGSAASAAGTPSLDPSRLPSWVVERTGDPGLGLISAMPAGVRLELVTDAPWIELHTKLTTLAITSGPTAELTEPATFDVVVGRHVVASVPAPGGDVLEIDLSTGAMEHRPGPTSTVRLELPDSHGPRPLEIWLPHNASVQLLDATAPAGATITAAPATGPVWVHYGSSISHCVNAPSPTRMWPAQVAIAAGVHLRDLAFGGQCHLDGPIARMLRDEPVDALSMKVGINVLTDDTMRERTFVPAFNAFVDTVRDGHPDIEILVISPISRPPLDDRPGPIRVGADHKVHPIERDPALDSGALTRRRVHELLASAVELRRGAGDSHVSFLDGAELLGPDEVADLPDDIHPTVEASDRIGRRFLELAFGPDRPFGTLATLDTP